MKSSAAATASSTGSWTPTTSSSRHCPTCCSPETPRCGSAITSPPPHPSLPPPLPNLLFTRDSSVWLGDHVAVTSPSMDARRRETWLVDVIYTHHPRFAGTPRIYSPGEEWLEGGDVLLLAPGVVAIGGGPPTTPPGAETPPPRALPRGV